MVKKIFSVFFSIAIFINSVVFTFLMAVGLLFVARTSKKKDYLHLIAGLWARNCVRLIFSTPIIKGLENLVPGENYIIVANHASNFDIFMLLGYLKLNTVFISKQANFKIPVIGLAMRMMGCIPIDRKSLRNAWESIGKAADGYKQGDSVVIFPESTRSPDGIPKPFKRSFLHIAKRFPVRILPVSLSGTFYIQPKRSWQISPAKILMVVEKPRLITPEEIKDREGSERVLSEIEETIRSHFVAPGQKI